MAARRKKTGRAIGNRGGSCKGGRREDEQRYERVGKRKGRGRDERREFGSRIGRGSGKDVDTWMIG